MDRCEICGEWSSLLLQRRLKTGDVLWVCEKCIPEDTPPYTASSEEEILKLVCEHTGMLFSKLS